jgi:hypothetical protein
MPSGSFGWNLVSSCLIDKSAAKCLQLITFFFGAGRASHGAPQKIKKHFQTENVSELE